MRLGEEVAEVLFRVFAAAHWTGPGRVRKLGWRQKAALGALAMSGTY